MAKEYKIDAARAKELNSSPLATYYRLAGDGTHTRTWRTTNPADGDLCDGLFVNAHTFTKPDTITIHCYVGQVTAEQGCDYFGEADRNASSNYVVGHDGSIGISVPENYRAATSGGNGGYGSGWGRVNDARAVTIETACNKAEPNYCVTDKAMIALVNLVTDICVRNNIPKLVWKESVHDRRRAVTSLENIDQATGKIKWGLMTMHEDYHSAKTCPGNFIKERLSLIAEEVNKRLEFRRANGITGDYEVVDSLPETFKADMSKWTYDSETFNLGPGWAVDYGTPTTQGPPTDPSEPEPTPDPEPDPEPEPEPEPELEIVSLSSSSVTHTAAQVVLQVNDIGTAYIKSYAWQYILEKAGVQQPSKTITVTSPTTNITIAGLQPGVPYKVKVTASKGAVKKESSWWTFVTTVPKLGQINSVNVLTPAAFILAPGSGDLGTISHNKCTLTFDNAASTQITKLAAEKVTVGYRLSVAVNGLQRDISSKDTVMKTDSLSTGTELDLAKVLSSFSFRYGDTVQLGLQTWFKDGSGTVHLNSDFPTYSTPIIVKYVKPVVGNICLMV